MSSTTAKPDLTSLYLEHHKNLVAIYSAAIEFSGNEGSESFDGVLIHSGSEQHHYGDDRAMDFQPFGHYHHWLPVARPDQFVLFRPGVKPCYFQCIPKDFWHDQSIETEAWWAGCFDIQAIAAISEIAALLPSSGKLCYLGGHPGVAEQLGLGENINPKMLLHYLDYQRAYKSEYEIQQLRTASRNAMIAHGAAKQAFLAGASEYQIHMAYLQACSALENECPYTSIVALDEKSAILHYQYKRKQQPSPAQVLLIDAGCRVRGYGSDVTRTWTSDDAHPVFKTLLQGMVKLEQELVASVEPGLPYPELHHKAHRGVAEGLIAAGISSAKEADELIETGIAQQFMPHGVGHLLGIQVHDVGGHQSDIKGTITAPPVDSPALRNTRILETDMVFTIEPGLYFIPMLLNPIRLGEPSLAKLLNWELIDELIPLGGIRIEDNVRLSKEGVENLTRDAEDLV